MQVESTVARFPVPRFVGVRSVDPESIVAQAFVELC